MKLSQPDFKSGQVPPASSHSGGEQRAGALTQALRIIPQTGRIITACEVRQRKLAVDLRSKLPK